MKRPLIPVHAVADEEHGLIGRERERARLHDFAAAVHDTVLSLDVDVTDDFLRCIDEIDAAALRQREIVGVDVLSDDLLVAARTVRNKASCGKLCRVQAAVGAESKRARPARVFPEDRDAARGVGFVDCVFCQIGKKDVAILVDCRACHRLVEAADLLPWLVAIDQRVHRAARAAASTGGRRRRRRLSATAGAAFTRRVRGRRQQFAMRNELREDAAPRAGLRLPDGDRLRIIAPEPSQRLGKHRRAVPVAVAVLAQFDAHVVAGELQRGGHSRILEIPAARVVDEILPAGLHEDADRPRLGAANQAGQAIRASEVAEAADPGDDAAKLIRTIPRGDEGADAAGADPGDGVIVRVLRKVIALADFGHELVDQEIREPRRQRVVLENALVSILRLVRKRRHHAGIHEDRDHRRDVAFRDQVVEDDRHAHVVAGVAAAVEENHVRDCAVAIVPGRYVNLIVVWRARKELSRREHVFGQRAGGDARLRLRVGGERVIERGWIAARRLLLNACRGRSAREPRYDPDQESATGN